VLKIATYNAGLLDTVGNVPERQPLVTEAVAALDADVVCMQEVWSDEHWDALVAANEDTRPHALRLEAMPGVPGQCTEDELLPLRACSELMCPNAGPSDLVSCTIVMCSDEVAVLSSSCTSCLVDNGGSGDLDVIEAACLGSSGASPDDLPLPPEERSYLLGGAFGIGLLSALPLMETDTLVLDAATTRRGIVYAKIDVPELARSTCSARTSPPCCPSWLRGQLRHVGRREHRPRASADRLGRRQDRGRRQGDRARRSQHQPFVTGRRHRA